MVVPTSATIVKDRTAASMIGMLVMLPLNNGYTLCLDGCVIVTQESIYALPIKQYM